MEKSPGISSEWRNSSLALPLLKHQCLHEFPSTELDFLSYFALKNEKDREVILVARKAMLRLNWMACTAAHLDIPVLYVFTESVQPLSVCVFCV